MLDMNLPVEVSRRQFLGRTGVGLGAAALATLLNTKLLGAARSPHFAPKAQRIIWLTQAGAPSQLDLFDYKPGLAAQFDKDLPDSVRGGQRLTGMTSGQKRFPIAPSVFKFRRQGKSGVWWSELLPYTAKLADDICIIRSLHTEAINHDPAMTLLQTGHPIGGRPSFGAWASYGLGSVNSDLPAFVALVSRPSGPTNAQPLHERMWGAGFLPSRYQGVRFNSGQDPVLYLSNPPGITNERRRAMLDDLAALNRLELAEYQDPETQSRIDQYEMAFRMQASVPELTDLTGESEDTYQLYGEDSKKRGTFANSALMARRLLERGVRFVQIFHRGWDQHGALPRDLASQCKDVDQGGFGLIQDLKRRGMLEDTLVIWGGEFGRTVYCQGNLTETDYGRDHHPRCFSIWMAGGGIKGGMVHGETDDMCYNIVRDPVHIRDLHATILHSLGLEHERLSFKAQGLDERLTGVLPAKVVKQIFA